MTCRKAKEGEKREGYIKRSRTAPVILRGALACATWTVTTWLRILSAFGMWHAFFCLYQNRKLARFSRQQDFCLRLFPMNKFHRFPFLSSCLLDVCFTLSKMLSRARRDFPRRKKQTREERDDCTQGWVVPDNQWSTKMYKNRDFYSISLI